MANKRKAVAPLEVQETLLHLLSVAEGSEFALPEAMAKEIKAISKVGSDPAWQISEMKKILDRWARRH